MKADAIQKIRDAGVIGAGGAGFPSHVKYGAEAEVVVVNGAECEPLLRVDQQLMVIEAEKMVDGLSTVVEITGAKEGIIALKGKYHEAIDTLSRVIADKPKLRIYILDDFYPAGDEHVTLYEATGRLVPQGGIPIKVGAVVTNVETLINVSNALEGIPVTETWLTLAGQVAKHITVKVPVGISIREAFALAGVSNFSGYGVIDGGPMMGKLVTDIDAPVVKAAKGYILLPEDHSLIAGRSLSIETILRRTQTACIQCRFCTDLCPRYLLGHDLEPHMIMRGLKYMGTNPEAMRQAFACTECGMCEQFACIGNISPRTVNAFVKRKLSEQGIKPPEPPADQQVNVNRNDRKVPVKRLISRLALTPYNVDAPIVPLEQSFERVQIPLKQHVGAPCEPIVAEGQAVKKGDMIGKIPERALGAPVHASIDGVVEKIDGGKIIVRGGAKA